MTSHVHEFDGVGVLFRPRCPTRTGNTTAHTDTYHGHFVKLVPNEQVIEVTEFETSDPAHARRDDDHIHAQGCERRYRRVGPP